MKARRPHVEIGAIRCPACGGLKISPGVHRCVAQPPGGRVTAELEPYPDASLPENG